MTNNPDVKRQVAIFEKDGIYSAIGIYSCQGHLHAVSNFDPRQRPENQFYRSSLETRELAFDRFHENVAITRDRGWQVIYNAPPQLRLKLKIPADSRQRIPGISF